MKRSRLFLLIAAMLALPCTNLFAQFKIDSVVFHLDSLKYDCTKTGLGGGAIIPNDQDFHFLSSSMQVVGDSVTYTGFGNIFSRTGMDSAIIGLRLDTLTGKVLSFYYHEEFVQSRYASYSMNIHNTTYKNNNGNHVLANPPSPPSSYLVSYKTESLYSLFDNENSVSCTRYLDFTSPNVRVTFFSSFPSGVKDEFAQKSLGIQPNPSATIITIRNFQTKNIELFDLLGRKRLTQSVSDGVNETSIDVSTLPAGPYWVRVGMQMEKIIIARK